MFDAMDEKVFHLRFPKVPTTIFLKIWTNFETAFLLESARIIL